MGLKGPASVPEKTVCQPSRIAAAVGKKKIEAQYPPQNKNNAQGKSCIGQPYNAVFKGFKKQDFDFLKQTLFLHHLLPIYSEGGTSVQLPGQGSHMKRFAWLNQEQAMQTLFDTKRTFEPGVSDWALQKARKKRNILERQPLAGAFTMDE